MTQPLMALASAPTPQAEPEPGRYVCRFGDLRSGELWGILPASGLSWTSELRATGTLSAAVPASPEAAGLWEATQEGRAMVAVEWERNFGRRILWASPVVTRSLDSSAVTVGGDGMFGQLNARLLIPNVTADQIAAAPAMTFTGDHGTMMARMLAQVLALDEGDLPIVLEAYRAGTRTGDYFGYDMTAVAQRISELADNQPPTDFALLPRFADGPDYTRIVWDFITGTETQPLLNRTASLPIIVDGTAPGQNTVKDVGWSGSAAGMGTHAFAKGEGTEGATPIRGAVDMSLTSQGWPRMDVVSSSNSTDGDAVQDYADATLAQAKRPMRGIKVKVDAQFWWSQDARLGDSVRVMFPHPIAGPIDITSRLLSESGDVATEDVDLVLADTLAEDVT